MSDTIDRLPIVVAPGGGERAWFLNSLMTVKATTDDTAGAYGLFESVVPPGFSPPTHVHHREDESYYVLEGHLTMRCGDTTFDAPAGTFACFPRDIPHSFVVEGDTPARVLTLITPGGGEGFFVDLGRPATNDELPPAQPVDISALRRVSATYGSEILGPPMTPTVIPT